MRSATWLPDAVGCGSRRGRHFLDVGAHRAQDVDDGAAGRVDADPVQAQLGVGMDGAGDEPERRRRDIPRDPFVHRLHRHTSLDRPGHRTVRAVRPRDRHAPGTQHPFRVIASRDRLADRRRPICPQPRQQDRRLHLRARHGRRDVDRPERGMTDHGQWWKGVVPSGVKLGAHRAQRFDDTSDRTATQRVVAVERARHRQAGQHARRQPQARPGIAAVERLGRLAQPVRARRHDDVVHAAPRAGRSGHGRPERGHDPRGRPDVRAVAGPVDPALTGGQCREHQGAMADRLVARQAELPAQAGARPDAGDGRLGDGGSGHRVGQAPAA